MIIRPTNLDHVFEIENKQFHDHRGMFVKTFHYGEFRKNGLEAVFKESFYSISKKNVIRGMHFQLPPHDHAKLVYVVAGEILDVVVDIREESATYGKWFSTKLSESSAKSLYIGKGFAHGFLTLSDSAIVSYMTTTIHSPAHDTGIRWDSFGFDWVVVDPVVSERDSGLPKLI